MKHAIQSGARAVIAERLTYFDVPSKASGKWSPNYSKSIDWFKKWNKSSFKYTKIQSNIGYIGRRQNMKLYKQILHSQ